MSTCDRLVSGGEAVGGTEETLARIMDANSVCVFVHVCMCVCMSTNNFYQSVHTHKYTHIHIYTHRHLFLSSGEDVELNHRRTAPLNSL
jgi:hypothetical protein